MLQGIQDFEVVLTGGIAIFGLLCMGFVVIGSLVEISKSVVKKIKS